MFEKFQIKLYAVILDTSNKLWHLWVLQIDVSSSSYQLHHAFIVSYRADKQKRRYTHLR